MAEELLEFENTIEDADGKSWIAVVMGAEREDAHWVGWIRFDPADGGDALVTDRETTQPNRDDLAYWATGLTYFYLEGALARARRKKERDEASKAPKASDAGKAGKAAREPPTRIPERGLPRLEVSSRDNGIVEEIMGARDARPGTIRKVPDAGLVVYEGASKEGEAMRHRFGVEAGDGTSRSNMANWLWSRLHRVGATGTVNGSGHLETNADLRQALER